MRVCLHFGRYQHHIDAINNFASGLRAHGQDYQILPDDRIKDCDLLVVWSANWPIHIDRQMQMGRDVLIMENGYVQRDNYRSLGFNGLNGRADFMNEVVPSDRGDKFRHLLEPPREGGEFVMIAGQVPGDAQVRHRINVADWADEVYEVAKSRHSLPVLFNPHPLGDATPKHCPKARRTLANCAAVYTFSSNMGVDALLRGIPACGLDRGSMIHDVCPDTPQLPERDAWLDRLAYAQWSDDEIREGDAWAHLKRRYD